MNTELDRHGYIIDRSNLTKTEIVQIKTDLKVKPQFGLEYDDVEPYKLYKDAEGKIVVPRFYGEKMFGKAKKNNLPEHKIDIKFSGKLRPLQNEILPFIVQDIKDKGGGLLAICCGFGKCLAKGTPVMMADGTRKKVEDITVGEQIMGDDTKPRNVLSLARGREEMFDIIPDCDYADKYTVNRSHILSLKVSRDYDQYKKNDIVDISVDDYLKLSWPKHILKGYQANNNLPYRIKVESIGEGDYYGFEIDKNRRFLLGDSTVTHNTVLGLKLIQELGLKTLVIVHKSFLMDQWVERIKQFTNARVGIIRQKKKDVKNKDIVIGMLQSLSMIDYTADVFKEFSLVIVDEVHHIGSRVYTHALNKVGSKYMVGLSATPNRADGLTKVIHWYLGEIITKIVRNGDKNVIIDRFSYTSDDDKLFTEKKKWVKGKIIADPIKMINNLCKLKDRDIFCHKIINILRKQYERKILVLSNRIAHLKKLKPMLDKVIKEEEENGICDVGEYTTAYYIGEMKGYELEDAAEANVIFATFHMAKEALDICKLNTLIFADPIKDLEQSVGRILRKELGVGDISPIIIDINDEISIFQNWSNIRLKYYKKNKYEINEYIAHNDDCICIKEYLKNKGYKCDNIRKDYICHQFGEEYYKYLERINEMSDSSDDEVENEKYYDKESFYRDNITLENILDHGSIESVEDIDRYKIVKYPDSQMH